MSDRKFSLVSLGNLGSFAPPVADLAKLIRATIGGFVEPWYIRSIAEAEADAKITLAKGEREAKLIEAETEIEIYKRWERAKLRLMVEQTSQQKNIEDIAQKSFPLVTEDAKPEDMENDWVTNFFSKARYISNEDVQKVWAKILAGEANKPGSFSRRTVNLLNDLGKQDVEMFEKLCNFGWHIDGNFTLVIFDPYDGIYNTNGVYFGALEHLKSLGLVHQLTGEDNYGTPQSSENTEVNYFGDRLLLKTPKGELVTGKTMLTQAGVELARITNRSPVERFYKYTKRMWSSHGHTTVREL